VDPAPPLPTKASRSPPTSLHAATGEPVLAIDSDPLPGLAFSIGVDRSDAGLPDDAVEPRPEGEPGPRYRLRSDLSPGEAVERHAAHGPDGLRFLQFGKLGGSAGELFRSRCAFRDVVLGLDGAAWHLVGDLPAGTRQAFFGWGGYARTVVVVVEPTAAACLSARRLARLGVGSDAPRVVAVANKVLGEADVDRIRAAVGLDLVTSVPCDEAVAACERAGVPLVDHAPDAPAVAAVRSLLDRLLEEAA
jgi:CO dehydrogenase maturation factor